MTKMIPPDESALHERQPDHTGLSLIAVVIPMYNEALRIGFHLDIICSTLRTFESDLGVKFRYILVDDGSRDDTPSIAKAFCAARTDCELVCFTRNFGKESALEAGIEKARGADAVIAMDSDLQHPPGLIPEMIRQWRNGYCIVEGIKSDRGKESWLYRRISNLFYSTFERLSGIDLYNRSDFKLLDAKVVAAYLALHERSRFFRGLIQWMGFPTASVSFAVPSREQGGSRWSIVRLIRYSIGAITSFSSAPLHVVILLGLFTFAFSIILGIQTIIQKWSGVATSGFTTVIVLLLFIGSVLMFSLGVIGIYLAQIYNEMKRRPNYMINPRTSFEPGAEPFETSARQ